MTHVTRFVHVLAILSIVCLRAEGGGGRSDIRGMGMARTSVAASRGLDAVGINPANLGLPGNDHMTISIFPFSVHAGSDFLSYDLYRTYFTGSEGSDGRTARQLTEQDKQDILAAFTDEFGRVSADAEARLFGLSYHDDRLGGAAFTITERAAFYAGAPRDYLSFLFYGNPPGSQYDFHDAVAQALWVREYALSFGFPVSTMTPVGPLALGVSFKLVHGRKFYEVERFNTTLVTAENGTLQGTVDFLARSAGVDIEEDNVPQALLFPEPAGSGVGFDLGVSSMPAPYLTVGISVTDVGSMFWSRNTEQVRAETTLVVDDPLNEQKRDAIEHAVRGERGSVESFSSPLPTTLRIGGMLSLHKLVDAGLLAHGMEICLDYTQGLRGAGTTEPGRVSLGFEYTPLRWFPLRGGLSIGGWDHLVGALGFGLHLGFFQFDVASDNLGWLFSPSSFSGGSISAGMRVCL
jgi:hypothetical protein